MFDIFYINNKPEVKSAIRARSINDAIKRSRTRYLWIVDGANDYSDFDFTWEPVPWESNQRHIWASQWQDNGGTYLIPKQATEESNYNSSVVKRNKVKDPFIFLDFGNTDSNKTFKQINQVSDNVTKTRFISSYHGTLSRVIDKVDSEYVWVTTSVCDYSNFNFTWHPSEWHREMFHVFPSNEQKFGDTFYIHVPTFKEQINKIELLEWYKTIHFVKDLPSLISRWSIPHIEVNDNSLVNVIKQYEFKEPVVLFTNNICKGFVKPTINLWREKTRAVVPLSDGANTTLIPRDAKNHIVTQVYDYPYVSKKNISYKDEPLDIMFVSNGETNADENWEHLLKVTEKFSNRVTRIDRVKGRAKSFYTSAKASKTMWYFAVPAKLKVSKDFDWYWQPDRLQQAKQYIFNAKNPITGLEYGHMATVAYNKELVLSNTPKGLDFTLDQAHEVVPILSGVSHYADSIDTAWRTAFREVIKLKNNLAKSNDIDSEYRLSKWLTTDGSEYGIWSQRGAEDAIVYFDSVNGNFDDLRLTYEWEWLDNYFNQKYEI